MDFDPDALSRWAQEGVSVLYGDAEDPELPKLLPLPDSGWIVSTIRRTDANLALLDGLTHQGYIGRVAVAAHRRDDVQRLLDAGADRVLLPRVGREGGRRARHVASVRPRGAEERGAERSPELVRSPTLARLPEELGSRHGSSWGSSSTHAATIGSVTSAWN